MLLQAVVPLALAIATTAWLMDSILSSPWTWILGVPTVLLLWVPAAVTLGFVTGLLRFQPRELIRMFEIGWERGIRLWGRRPQSLLTEGLAIHEEDLQEAWERSLAESQKGSAPRPWQQLGLEYPTSPIDNPEFVRWVEIVTALLAAGETLVDFGSANEVDLLLASPGSASGEGVFAVTNLRSLFMYVDAPRETTELSVLEIKHSDVMSGQAETAWADVRTGATYAESDAPSQEALRQIAESGMPKMAFVSIRVDPGNPDWPRTTRFLTGFAAGQNWTALIRRFKADPTLPAGWEPPALR